MNRHQPRISLASAARVRQRIDAFKRGSEDKLCDCHDWSAEIFGKVGEDGAVEV